MSEWDGPARSGQDPCPVCGKPCAFASDFKKFGEHRIRVCLNDCRAVYENGKKINDVDVRGDA